MESVNNVSRISAIIRTAFCKPWNVVLGLLYQPFQFPSCEREGLLFRSLLRFLSHEVKPNLNRHSHDIRHSQGIRKSLIWSLETWLHLELPVRPQTIFSIWLRFLLVGQKTITTYPSWEMLGTDWGLSLFFDPNFWTNRLNINHYVPSIPAISLKNNSLLNDRKPCTSRDSLQEEMATHPSILTWDIPWTEESGRLQSMGSQRVGQDQACTCPRTHTRTHTHTHIPVKTNAHNSLSLWALIHPVANMGFNVHIKESHSCSCLPLIWGSW